MALNWGLYGVPETVFVDAAGIVRHKHIGALTGPAVRREVEALLAGPAGAAP